MRLSGLLLLGVLLLPSQLDAAGLDSLLDAARRVVRPAASPDRGALARAAAYIKTLAPKPEAVVLAAESTPEGHWRFVNRAGETITAGTAQEMRRIPTLLAPEAKPEAHLSLYLTEETVFARRALLKDLPRASDLYVLVNADSYRVLKRGEGASERLFAEIRGNLVVELADRAEFAEAVYQLARPLDRAQIRILALEPASAARLPPSPRIDPASKKALIDSIDPDSLASALGTVSGQTVLITGRIDGRLVYFKPASAAERSLSLEDLFKAAEVADVNLIVLGASSTPRQPGGRNWLWQKVEVKGLTEALQHARVADFYNALAAANGRYLVGAKPAGAVRTVLDIAPITDLPRAPPSRPIGDVLSDTASGLMGRVITAGVVANVRSAALQRDIDWRFVANVPASIQIGYLALMTLGFCGAPVARRWWQRIWPCEDAAEYAGRSGYWAASSIRLAAFVLVFLPLTALISAPLNLRRQSLARRSMAPRGRRLLPGKARRGSAEASPTPDGHGAAQGGGRAVDRGLGSYRPSR